VIDAYHATQKSYGLGDASMVGLCALACILSAVLLVVMLDCVVAPARQQPAQRAHAE
jgi:hypothetical protein